MENQPHAPSIPYIYHAFVACRACDSSRDLGGILQAISFFTGETYRRVHINTWACGMWYSRCAGAPWTVWWNATALLFVLIEHGHVIEALPGGCQDWDGKIMEGDTCIFGWVRKVQKWSIIRMENGVELSILLHEVDIESHVLKRDAYFFGINLTICILVRKLRGNSPPKINNHTRRENFMEVYWN